MGKKLVSRTAKVLSETKKSKDKEAIAIAYEHIPRNPEEQRHGSIYAVIEIEDNGGHAEVIADSILDALHNEYYLDTERDTISSFEAALAKVNEELAERSSEGQINWLGKLNAVLAVLSESTLHLSQAGKAEAYLYRGEQTMHVTENLSGDSINPLRTFINVASGDLTENDRVAFVTPGVFLKLSKSELRRFSTESSPKMAVDNLSKVLSGENSHTLPNAVLLLEMVSPEAYANEPEPDISTEAWVKPANDKLEPVSDSTLKGAAKVFDIMGKAATGAAAFVSTKVIPGIKTGSSKIRDKIKGFKKEGGAEKIILEDEKGDIAEDIVLNENEIKIQDAETPNLEITEDDNEVTESTTPGVNEFRIREEDTPKRLSLERFDFSFATKARDWTAKKAKGLKLPGKNKKLFLIGGAVLAVALIGLMIFNINTGKAEAEAKNKYTQAQEKYEEALTEVAAGQKNEAMDDLETAESLALEVKNSKYSTPEVDKLLADIEATQNQIEGITKNTATEFYNFDKGELNAVYSDGNLLYVLKNEDGSVYALDPKAKTLATIIEKPNLGGKIIFSTFIANRKVIVAYTTNNEIYEIDLSGKKATKQNISGTLESGIALSSFNSNIYILSPEENEIFKHTKISGGYGQKTAYFSSTENPNISDAKDLMIDSNIYVLNSNGQVEKYTAGKKQTFSVNGLPESASGVEHIFGNESTNGFYLYSKDKILKIDENQNFSTQYISDSVSDIKSMVAFDNSNIIFALSQGKLYAISY